MRLQDILCAVFKDEVRDKSKLRNLFTIGLYSRSLRWLGSEKIKTYRFAQILDSCFGESPVAISKKYYKQIVEFESNEISPYEMLSLDLESIYKRWDRMLTSDYIPAKATLRLELATFLTALIATDLAVSGNDQVYAFINLYYKCLNILGIECDDNTIRHLCPGNFLQAKEYWCRAITGKEYQDIVLPYDLLCLTIYLTLWRLRCSPTDEVSINNVVQLWQTNLHFYSLEPEFENTNLLVDDVLQRIKQETAVDSPPVPKPNVPDSELSRNNDLFRDPRFLRQANLYYNIDMEAIFEVLNCFQREGLTVLDLGCGDGEVTCSRFSGIAGVTKVICIDSDPHQIETAKARFGRDPHKEKFFAYQVDLRDDDLVYQLRSILKQHGVERVDIVFSALTFHYLPSPESVLSHVRTIMSDDGFIIMRELDDDTKIYYSQGDIKSAWMERAIGAYQKVSKYSDRNCARKMHSWLTLQGYSDVKLFYEQIDTCGKNPQERKDIFYIMVGFRKARAEKMLREEAGDTGEEKYLNDVIQACNELERLFDEEDFWFLFTNYIAIARNGKYRRPQIPSCPVVELYLVRHAHCDVMEKDGGIAITVSDAGLREIEALTARLSNIPFDEVVCSTMERAVRTALPIAETHDVPLTQYPELNEIDRGDVITDQMWSENGQYYQRWKKHETDMPFPNGENGMDVWLRSKYVIDRIREASFSKRREDGPYRVCVVTHGGTIRALICGLLGIPERMRYQFAANLRPCSISVIRLSPDPTENANTDSASTLELFNDISHLESMK